MTQKLWQLTQQLWQLTQIMQKKTNFNITGPTGIFTKNNAWKRPLGQCLWMYSMLHSSHWYRVVRINYLLHSSSYPPCYTYILFLNVVESEYAWNPQPGLFTLNDWSPYSNVSVQLFRLSQENNPKQSKNTGSQEFILYILELHICVS